MKGYHHFADYYDQLTFDVDYTKLCRYLLHLLGRYGHKTKLLLDLACGTGTLAVLLAQNGIDVIGADASPQMLSIAYEKAAAAEQQILFIEQDMEHLDLYGTVDCVFCTLDSINHLNKDQVIKAFSRIALFLEKDGFFIFDVNTEYKFQCILKDQIFISDCDDVYCVWENAYDRKQKALAIHLTLFGTENGVDYKRTEERFTEYFHSPAFLEKMLAEAGFHLVDVFQEYTETPPNEKTERLFFITKKE